MGFPVGYSELPALLLHTLLLLGHIRRLISCLFHSLGLDDLLLLDSDPPITTFHHQLCRLEPHPLPIDDILPIVPYYSLCRYPPESCVVCLHEIDGPEEVRQLSRCCHVFHRRCLDQWIGHGQHTCPLCRAPLFPEEAGYDWFYCDGRFNSPFLASSTNPRLLHI